MDDDRLVEKLEPFGKAACDEMVSWVGGRGLPWNELTKESRVLWSRVADAVLTAYDPEWPSRKAGL
jgi:hypothetical protein